MIKSVLAGGVFSVLSWAAAESPVAARILFLDTRGRVLSANPDGSNLKIVFEGRTGGPDGVVVDPRAGHIYWSNMGAMSANDGSIARTDLEGKNLTYVVPVGGAFTPKQLKLDSRNGKLYWSDREGMRVMRSNLDGSNIETLIETAQGDEARRDARNWCVGIALDLDRGQIYWSQKGGSNSGTGSIRRAAIEIPNGQDAAHRTDIEVLFEGLPEPIDLDLDLARRTIYWTDRGDPPRGNTVNRAPMDVQSGRREDPEIIFTHLMEGIGLALDLKNARMFLTDLGGSVYRCNLDGSEKKALLFAEGNLSGIAYAEIPR